MPVTAIEVVVHPQSIVHSLVQYIDGSTLAQLGHPDMRTPIAHALGFPDRLRSGVASLDLLSLGALQFEAPDRIKFPCLGLAEEAARCGGTMPAVLNAANEVAVAAFLASRVNFTGIAPVISEVLEHVGSRAVHSIEDVLEADSVARQVAHERLLVRGSRSA